MKIKYIDFGTGNRVGDTIYLYKELKNYPHLHDAVLEHERRHSGRFSMFDFKLDLRNHELSKVKNDWVKFVITHPKTWINYFPIVKLGGNWTIDISLSVLWIAFLIMGYLAWTII